MGIEERWSGFRPLPLDIADRLACLGPLLGRHRVRLAYVFGSLAHRRHGGDVDLALLPGPRTDMTKLRQKLVDALGTERLDLLDLSRGSPLQRFEVVRSGRLLFKRDEEFENRFELGVVREYQDTTPLRAAQDAILRRRNKEWLSRKKQLPLN